MAKWLVYTGSPLTNCQVTAKNTFFKYSMYTYYQLITLKRQNSKTDFFSYTCMLLGMSFTIFIVHGRPKDSSYSLNIKEHGRVSGIRCKCVSQCSKEQSPLAFFFFFSIFSMTKKLSGIETTHWFIKNQALHTHIISFNPHSNPVKTHTHNWPFIESLLYPSQRYVHSLIYWHQHWVYCDSHFMGEEMKAQAG